MVEGVVSVLFIVSAPQVVTELVRMPKSRDAAVRDHGESSAVAVIRVVVIPASNG